MGYSFFIIKPMYPCMGYSFFRTPQRFYAPIKTAKGYLPKLMLPADLRDETYMKFDGELYHHVCQFLKNNDPRMIYIYGEVDPWSASGIFNNETDFLKDKKNLKVFVQPRGSHRTRISTMPEPMRTEIMSQIWSWLNEK